MNSLDDNAFEGAPVPEWCRCRSLSKAGREHHASAQHHTISAIIVDVHPLLSGALEKRLTEDLDLDIVERSFRLEELKAAVCESPHVVDIVILHVARVDEAVESAIREIVRDAPVGAEPNVLVVSGSESDQELAACIRCGARGYLSNTAELGALSLTIRLVARGGAGFNASVATRLPAIASSGLPPSRPAGGGPLAVLTTREREVVKLLAEGRSNRSIARELFVSERTVRNHLSHVFLKLGVRDRVQAVLLARDGRWTCGD